MTWMRYRSGPLRDPVTAIMAGVAGGTSLFSGIFGKKSTSDAAKDVTLAARTAGDQVVNTTAEQNQRLEGAVDPVNQAIKDAALAGTQRVDTATTEANNYLAPYRTAGAESTEQLRTLLAPGGDLNRNYVASDVQLDPGYEFQRAEGEKIAKAQAYAGGSGASGAQQKALVRYNQDYANTGFKEAFNRYRQTNQDRYDRLFGVSGRGQQAATETGDNLIEGGKFGAGLNVDAVNRTGQNTLQTIGTTTGRAIDAEGTRQNYITDAASASAQAKLQGDQQLISGVNGAATGIANAFLPPGRRLANPSSRVNYITPSAQTPPFMPTGRTR